MPGLVPWFLIPLCSPRIPVRPSSPRRSSAPSSAWLAVFWSTFWWQAEATAIIVVPLTNSLSASGCTRMFYLLHGDDEFTSRELLKKLRQQSDFGFNQDTYDGTT